MNETVLVTGGAGYIGSHTSLALLEAGYRVVIYDNLSTGKRRLVPDGAELVVADLGDDETLRQVLRDRRIAAVLHFAGSIIVPESVADPLKYYANNTGNSRALIAACVDLEVSRFIFSSTAAVYGMPDEMPVRESTPTVPINPYGWSKLMTERMLADVDHAHPLRHGVLRYFNVAGADPDGRSGQVIDQATHLIKVACETACGRREGMALFGTDYPTPDGTCVRDFIHVSDLAQAHVDLLGWMEGGDQSVTLNCGYGRGYSVQQVIDTVSRVAGREIAVTAAPRRAGDPPEIVADSSRLKELLGWQPRHDDLETICATTLAWERGLD